ncbi:Uncharacterized protein APZ42_013762 [Daphnia magna]|uniref:Peptidase A2 domain-containing protein n=1 Tax=Daphnia magna TaxID=35525 RepID=A0A162QIH0_9CRUS|nr:Uncharacterized protein APZ42_013762 [Daphnia magna]
MGLGTYWKSNLICHFPVRLVWFSGYPSSTWSALLLSTKFLHPCRCHRYPHLYKPDHASQVKLIRPCVCLCLSSPYDEPPDWETTIDPVRLKRFRTTGKSIHTKSGKRLMTAVQAGDDRDTLRALRATYVCDYDDLERRHDRFLQFSPANLSPEAINGEQNWLQIQEAERFQKQAKFKLQKAQDEAVRRTAEDAALRQAEDYQRQVAADRRQRELQDQIHLQRLSGAILKQQLNQLTGNEQDPSERALSTGSAVLWHRLCIYRDHQALRLLHTHPPSCAYTPDAWIHTLGSQNTTMNRSGAKPPRMKAPSFDGDPRHWPMFIQMFKVFVQDTVSSDAERIAHLYDALTPTIRKDIGGALLNPGLFQHALSELHKRYGNPQIVSQACASSLLKLQPFRDNDYKALRAFSADLHSVAATLRLGGYGMELHSHATLSQLVSKFPPALRSRWREKRLSMQPHLPTVEDFDQWLDGVAMAEQFNQPNCDGVHHPLLYGALRLYPKLGGQKKAGFSGSVATGSTRPTLLPIVPVILRTNGKETHLFAFLDGGSEISVIKKGVATLLGLEGRVERVVTRTGDGESRPTAHKIVTFDIASLDGHFTFNIMDVQVMDTLRLKKDSIELTGLSKKLPHLAHVLIHSVLDKDVAILIGQDHPAAIEIFETHKDPYDQRAPRAYLTAFGWCVAGPAVRPEQESWNCFHLSLAENRCDTLLQQFIEFDTFGTKPNEVKPISPGKAKAWKILRETPKNNGERYESGLLWKSDDPALPNNFFAAKRRLSSKERKFLVLCGISASTLSSSESNILVFNLNTL